MRRRFVLTALAGFFAVIACCTSASAYEYREGWYKAYERHREAVDRYRAKREVRSYERYVNNQEYRTYERYSYGPQYRDYSRYRDYHYGPRVYSYSDYSDYSHSSYDGRELNDRRWRPEDYPAGWSAWWLRMDREGRAGRE